MLSGLIGKKLGMTQVGDAPGRVQPVTVIQLGPCAVTQIRAQPTDGYEAVQVTYGKRRLSRVTAAQRGHFAKAEVAAGIATREFGKRGEGELKLGQTIARGRRLQARRPGRCFGDLEGTRLCRRNQAPSFCRLSRLARYSRIFPSRRFDRQSVLSRAGYARACGWLVRWVTKRRRS